MRHNSTWITSEIVARAVKASRESNLGRAIVPLNDGEKNLIGPTAKNQYFLNAFQLETQVEVHLHRTKLESFTLVQGKILVILFSEEGDVEETQLLQERGQICFIKAGRYHTVVPLVEDSVVYEFKEDPYDALTDKELPSWLPTPTQVRESAEHKIKHDNFFRWLPTCNVGENVEHIESYLSRTPNTRTNEETGRKTPDPEALDRKLRSINRQRMRFSAPCLGGGTPAISKKLPLVQAPAEEPESFLETCAKFFSNLSVNWFCNNPTSDVPAEKLSAFNKMSFFDTAPTVTAVSQEQQGREAFAITP